MTLLFFSFRVAVLGAFGALKQAGLFAGLG
jgi:hypothetical protein